MTKTLTLKMLFDQLLDEGQIDPSHLPDESAMLQSLTESAKESDSPWYVKVMVGFSAWLAALILGVFFGIAGLIDTTESMLIWGAILCVGAVTLKRLTLPSIFWGQLAFAASLVGQGLLIAGVATKANDVTGTLFFVIGLELLLLVVYPDLLHRLLSFLAVCAAIVGLIVNWEIMDAIHFLTLLLATGAVLVWLEQERFLSGRFAAFHAPVGYGLIISLFAVMLLKVADIFELLGSSSWWLSSLALAAVLLWLGLWTLKQLNFPMVSLATAGMIGALAMLAIPSYDTPGILAAVLVLLLGFWCSNRILMGLATFFLLLFLGIYYYYLDVTLLNKSYILMGSGGVLLVLWAIFHKFVGTKE